MLQFLVGAVPLAAEYLEFLRTIFPGKVGWRAEADKDRGAPDCVAKALFPVLAGSNRLYIEKDDVRCVSVSHSQLRGYSFAEPLNGPSQYRVAVIVACVARKEYFGHVLILRRTLDAFNLSLERRASW